MLTTCILQPETSKCEQSKYDLVGMGWAHSEILRVGRLLEDTHARKQRMRAEKAWGNRGKVEATGLMHRPS
jgi:hypothetical protein